MLVCLVFGQAVRLEALEQEMTRVNAEYVQALDRASSSAMHSFTIFSADLETFVV